MVIEQANFIVKKLKINVNVLQGDINCGHNKRRTPKSASESTSTGLTQALLYEQIVSNNSGLYWEKYQ